MTEVQIINAVGEQLAPVQGYKKYEDSSFTAEESPKILDIKTDLGRIGTSGYIACDGTGDILVEFSTNGTDYGDQFTLKDNEILDLEKFRINKIRITHSGSNSAYRVMVV